MRCKKMPTKLSDWDTYKHLSDRIKAFETVLPLLTELCKESTKMRHWEDRSSTRSPPRSRSTTRRSTG